MCQFLFFCFAELKRYQFSFAIAFPTINPPALIVQESAFEPLIQVFSDSQCRSLAEQISAASNKSQEKDFIDLCGFLIEICCEEDRVRVSPLSDLLDEEFFHHRKEEEEEPLIRLGFMDTGGQSSAIGWPVRNLLLALAVAVPKLRGKLIQLVGIRLSAGNQQQRLLQRSVVVKVRLPLMGDSMIFGSDGEDGPLPGSVVGWERGKKRKAVDMGTTMDPKLMAASHVALNLKLMKWRQLPSLDLDRIASQRCLLFGSGTLGCYVARMLLAWGVKTITLVDSGRVSFSNPVRQPLFNFEDCLEGGKGKAEAAAAALRQIFPGVEAKGVQARIPMPGHPLSAPTISEFEQLQQLAVDHDVFFLLTDSRESRWLPSVLAAAHRKICITAALGFDSYTVLRHGHSVLDCCTPPVPSQESSSVKLDHSTNERLSCYFCIDTDAPTNSQQQRALDQQCTVTRPGVSLMASGYAVELMVGIVSHPLGNFAPVDNNQDVFYLPPQKLGIVPHQLRGYLSHFVSSTFCGTSSPYCTACSLSVRSFSLESFPR